MIFSKIKFNLVVQLEIFKQICRCGYKKKFGIRLKELRLQKGLSQEKLANIAEIDRTYIPSIEKGKRNVSITVIERLARALNVEIIELIE